MVAMHEEFARTGAPTVEGNELVGTLRRAYDLDGTVGAACVLVTDDGQAFHLSSIEGIEEPSARDPFAALRRFESQVVKVFFDDREDTVFGPALSGVRVEVLA